MQSNYGTIPKKKTKINQNKQDMFFQMINSQFIWVSTEYQVSAINMN